jgi:hypothetical protein
MKDASQLKEFEHCFSEYEQSVAIVAQGVASDFSSFFEDFRLQDLSARKQRVLDTPHLSVLRVFGLERRELRHSDALAWFLREDSEHEQGDLFMHTLLEYVGLRETRPLPPYTVDREKPEHVDIATYSAERFAVFIENKIQDRAEEPRQFEGLVDALVKLSDKKRIPQQKRTAIFLTDDGRPPDTGPKPSEVKVAMRNVRRCDLFEAFAEALHARPTSPLLDNLLKNYLSEIKQLV